MNGIQVVCMLVSPSIVLSSSLHYNNLKNDSYKNVKFDFKFLNFYLSSV
jgi:hypothetical protein